MNEKDTTTTPELDAEEAQLRQMAAQADEAIEQDNPDNESADERGDREPEAEGGAKDKRDLKNDAGTAAASPDKDKPKPTDKPKADSEQQTEKSQTDKNPPKESQFTRLQKEQERLARNRREFEEEKARERAQIQRERDELRQLREQSQRREAPKDTGPLAQYSADDLEAAAKRFEAAGKYDLAEDARAAAKDKRAAEQQQRQHAPAAGQAEAGDGAPTPQFLAEWKTHLQRETEANPDLQNRESPLYKATAGLLQSEPWLTRMPDGISKAVRVAKLQAEAAAVPTLKQKIADHEAKIAEQEKELNELRAATSPSSGSAESRGRVSKDIDEMTDEEAEAELRRVAAEADRFATA